MGDIGPVSGIFPASSSILALFSPLQCNVIVKQASLNLCSDYPSRHFTTKLTLKVPQIPLHTILVMFVHHW